MLTLTSPRETWLHGVPAGWKLLALCLATVLLFRIEAPAILAAVLAGLALAYLGFGRAFFRHGLGMLRPLLPFAVVVGLWHAWIGEPMAGAMIVVRLVTAVALANLVTMTTRLSDIVGVVERIAAPLARIGLKPKALALAIALAIRFVPVLGQKIGLIQLAWKARSPHRPGWRIFVPAMLAVLDDADHVADALRARGGIE
jgi:biotin transport system permease protein